MDYEFRYFNETFENDDYEGMLSHLKVTLDVVSVLDDLRSSGKA